MGHLFKYKLKTLLRNKIMIFWTLIFPIALGTMFYFAFSNLAQEEKFESINIGVVENEQFSSLQGFKELVDVLSKEGQLFNTTYYNQETNAKKALEDKEIEGYYIVKDKIEMVVLKSGISQTIMKSVSDRYYQSSSVILHLIQTNPTGLTEDIYEQLNQDTTYFQDKNTNNLDNNVIYFYTLIGMACMYAGFFGIYNVKETEANLSKKGARLSVAPTSKFLALLMGSLVSLLVHFINCLILLAYLVFVLKIDFGSQIPQILLLILIGSFCGLCLGTFVGVSNKKSEDFKTSLMVISSLLLSFLSGMMVQKMKYMIDTYLPFLAKINPVNLITDSLYSLYYYDNLIRYTQGIIMLLIISFILFFASLLFIRRKQYDSI